MMNFWYTEPREIPSHSANSAGVAISFGTRIEISVLIVQYLLVLVRFMMFNPNFQTLTLEVGHNLRSRYWIVKWRVQLEDQQRYKYGRKEAIKRLMTAYGFNTQIALVEHLQASKSTMANRMLRDSFPADWVIQCALETGISLLWLTTGQGEMYPQADEK